MLERDLLAVAAEAVELVDELVDNVPGPRRLRQMLVALLQMLEMVPYVGNVDVHGSVRVQDEVEKVAVVVVARKLGLESRLELQRCCGSRQLCLNVSRADGWHPVQVVHSIVLSRLAVLVGHNFLLCVRHVGRCARGVAVLMCRGRALSQVVCNIRPAIRVVSGGQEAVFGCGVVVNFEGGPNLNSLVGGTSHACATGGAGTSRPHFVMLMGVADNYQLFILYLDILNSLYSINCLPFQPA